MITGNDLDFYRFTADATVSSFNGDSFLAMGTYQIYYDLNRDGVFESNEPTVSSGTLDLDVTVTSTTPFPFGSLTGTLTQTSGPSVSNFASLPSPASVDGAFLATSPSGDARFEATLTSVPEPSTWALMDLGVLSTGLVTLRRR